MTELPTQPCDQCGGTGRVTVRRYFRKLGHPAKGVLHLAVSPPFRGYAWRCGCGTTSTTRRYTRTEWLAERGDLPLCVYLRKRLANGAHLP